MLDIIGKKIDNPLVDLYKKRFPFYDLKLTEDGQSLRYKHPDGLEFTVEELVAMLFKQAQNIAEKAAGNFYYIFQYFFNYVCLIHNKQYFC